MYEIKDVTGMNGGECYLVLSEKSAVLLDTGFDFSAAKTVERVQEGLDGRILEGVLISHSHYDHTTGAAVIKKAFPQAVIVAHPHVSEVFAKRGAREQMRTLNGGAARRVGMFSPVDYIDSFRVDKEAKDGERFLFGDIAVEMMETPGHTRCSTSWYFPNDGLLYASETSGVAPRYPVVESAFIIGYQMTLDAIARMRKRNATRIVVPHSGLIPEKAPGDFLKLALASAEEMKEFIWQRHQRGMDDWEIILEVKGTYYNEEYEAIQPEAAFDLNMQAMVPRLIAELEGAGERQ